MLLALGLLLWPAPARARLTVAVNLDSTSQGAHAVWIATVTSVKPAGMDTYHGTPVNLLDVHLRIEEALKGPRPAHPVVRHLRVAPNAQPMINGFFFVELGVGKTYLLFLRRDPAGRLVLVANEDSNLVVLSPADVASFRRLPPKASLTERLVDLVANQLARCTSDCMPAIWLLSNSQTHKLRLKGLQVKRAFIAQLVRVSRKSSEENDVNAAYTVLGELDYRPILPELVKRICAPQGPNRNRLQVNSVTWLQGFPDAVQLRALRQVVRQAQDPPTRAEAARHVRDLTRSKRP